ncbi:MAG: hypothetical protein Q8K79_17815 [Solirubrobacteraceae bacterium]|nr:hypothetical protein [Solirubrobacteraceae bacterium]
MTRVSALGGDPFAAVQGASSMLPTPSSAGWPSGVGGHAFQRLADVEDDGVGAADRRGGVVDRVPRVV